MRGSNIFGGDAAYCMERVNQLFAWRIGRERAQEKSQSFRWRNKLQESGHKTGR